MSHRHRAKSHLSLTAAPCGQRLKIVEICATCPDCARLQEMGFRAGEEVCKVTQAGALICRLSGSRVALGKELGTHVHVVPLAA
jgi:Fe2+ transport system protein FeoA